MSQAQTPKRSTVRVMRAPWRRDLAASVVLAAGIFLGALSFATVWAATHPELRVL